MKHTWVWIFTKLSILWAVVLSGVWGYSYYIWNQIDSQASIVEKIYTWMNNFGYEEEFFQKSWNINSKLSIKLDEEDVFNASGSISNLEYISGDKGLKQRIQADKVNLEVNGESLMVENIDIVSKNTDNYMYFQWAEKYLEDYAELKEILSTGKYAHIDNKKNTSQQFPNFGEDSLIKLLLESVTTSNPDYYLEKENFEYLLAQEIRRDNWIQYFFVKDEEKSTDEKTLFYFNDGICDDFWYYFEELDALTYQEANQGCKKAMSQLNTVLAFAWEISAQWDYDKWNYSFSIAFADIVNFSADYQKNIVNTWKFSINQVQWVSVDMQWDKIKTTKSNIVVDIKNDEENYIKWEIINGKWTIVLQTKNSVSNLEWELVFGDYIPKKYHLEWNIRKMNINAKWNLLAWEIDISESRNWESIGKINLKHSKLDHNLIIESPKVDISSVKKWKNYAFSIEKRDSAWDIMTEWKMVFSNGKITGFLKDKLIDLIVEGEYTQKYLKKLTIEWNFEWNDILYSFHWDDFQKDTAKISFGSEVNKQRVFDVTMEKSSQVLQMELKNTSYTLSIDIPSRKIFVDGVFEFNQTTPQSTFEVPENFTTIENKNLIFTLPNYTELSWYKISFISDAVFIWAWMGWILAHISFLEHQLRMQEAYIYANLKTIISTIETTSIKQWVTLDYFLVEDDQAYWENEIRFWGEKIPMSNAFQTWLFNKELLSDLFSDEHKVDYHFAYLYVDELPSYQVWAFIPQSWWTHKFIAKWTYAPRTIVRYDFEKVEDFENTPEENATETQSLIRIENGHHFRVGDITNIWKITEIHDGKIWLDSEIWAGKTKILLFGNDSPTLFFYNGKGLENNQVIENYTK